MKNIEKFEQVFNVKATEDVGMCCFIAEDEVCKAHSHCDGCPYDDWWNQEYKGGDRRIRKGEDGI